MRFFEVFLSVIIQWEKYYRQLKRHENFFTYYIIGELIYTCKMIQPGIFSRFSQPVYFSRL